MTTQRQEGGIFETFNGYKNNTIAVVPNSTETLVHIPVIKSFVYRSLLYTTIQSTIPYHNNLYNVILVSEIFKCDECPMVINVGLSWQTSFKFHGV